MNNSKRECFNQSLSYIYVLSYEYRERVVTGGWTFEK